MEPQRDRQGSPGYWRNGVPTRRQGIFYKSEAQLQAATRVREARREAADRERAKIETLGLRSAPTGPPTGLLGSSHDINQNRHPTRASRPPRRGRDRGTMRGLKYLSEFDRTDWRTAARDKLDVYNPKPRELTADADYIDEFLYGHLLHHPRIDDWISERAPEDVDLPAPVPPTFTDLGYETSLDLRRKPKYLEEFQQKQWERAVLARKRLLGQEVGDEGSAGSEWTESEWIDGANNKPVQVSVGAPPPARAAEKDKESAGPPRPTASTATERRQPPPPRSQADVERVAQMIQLKYQSPDASSSSMLTNTARTSASNTTLTSFENYVRRSSGSGGGEKGKDYPRDLVVKMKVDDPTEKQKHGVGVEDDPTEKRGRLAAQLAARTSANDFGYRSSTAAEEREFAERKKLPGYQTTQRLAEQFQSRQKLDRQRQREKLEKLLALIPFGAEGGNVSGAKAGHYRKVIQEKLEQMVEEEEVEGLERTWITGNEILAKLATVAVDFTVTQEVSSGDESVMAADIDSDDALKYVAHTLARAGTAHLRDSSGADLEQEGRRTAQSTAAESSVVLVRGSAAEQGSQGAGPGDVGDCEEIQEVVVDIDVDTAQSEKSDSGEKITTTHDQAAIKAGGPLRQSKIYLPQLRTQTSTAAQFLAEAQAGFADSEDEGGEDVAPADAVAGEVDVVGNKAKDNDGMKITTSPAADPTVERNKRELMSDIYRSVSSMNEAARRSMLNEPLVVEDTALPPNGDVSVRWTATGIAHSETTQSPNDEVDEDKEPDQGSPGENKDVGDGDLVGATVQDAEAIAAASSATPRLQVASEIVNAATATSTSYAASSFAAITVGSSGEGSAPLLKRTKAVAVDGCPAGEALGLQAASATEITQRPSTAVSDVLGLCVIDAAAGTAVKIEQAIEDAAAAKAEEATPSMVRPDAQSASPASAKLSNAAATPAADEKDGALLAGVVPSPLSPDFSPGAPSEVSVSSELKAYREAKQQIIAEAGAAPAGADPDAAAVAAAAAVSDELGAPASPGPDSPAEDEGGVPGDVDAILPQTEDADEKLLLEGNIGDEPSPQPDPAEQEFLKEAEKAIDDVDAVLAEADDDVAEKALEGMLREGEDGVADSAPAAEQVQLNYASPDASSSTLVTSSALGAAGVSSSTGAGKQEEASEPVEQVNLNYLELPDASSSTLLTGSDVVLSSERPQVPVVSLAVPAGPSRVIEWKAIAPVLPLDESQDEELIALFHSLGGGKDKLSFQDVAPPDKLLRLLVKFEELAGLGVRESDVLVLPDGDQVFLHAFDYATEHSDDPGISMDEDGLFHFLTYLLDLSQLRTIFIAEDPEDDSTSGAPAPAPSPYTLTNPQEVTIEEFKHSIAALRVWGMTDLLDAEFEAYWKEIGGKERSVEEKEDLQGVKTFLEIVDWAVKKAADEHDIDD